MRIIASKTVAFGTIAATVIFAALCGSTTAQEKVWKHGLINAKADAGIFLMVSTRDFATRLKSSTSSCTGGAGLGSPRTGTVAPT